MEHNMAFPLPNPQLTSINKQVSQRHGTWYLTCFYGNPFTPRALGPKPHLSTLHDSVLPPSSFQPKESINRGGQCVLSFGVRLPLQSNLDWE